MLLNLGDEELCPTSYHSSSVANLQGSSVYPGVVPESTQRGLDIQMLLEILLAHKVPKYAHTSNTLIC